jgi:hypothetical protein
VTPSLASVTLVFLVIASVGITRAITNCPPVQLQESS